jgi:AcrR family transcriptional regulator
MPKPPTTTQLAREASARRRDEQKTGLREVIYRAAADLLVESGYSAFSLRKLAARIGYTPTTIYRYFRDKDELIMAITMDGFEEFGRTLAAAASSVNDPFERMQALGRAYMRFGLDHPVLYRVLFMQRSDVWQKVPPDRMRHGGPDAFGVLVQAVHACVATGRTRSKDVEGLALASWAVVHGAVALSLTMPFMNPDLVHKMTESALRLADLQIQE